jgi:phage shock protein PspC (stress-responsive transcriptional regulator)
MKKNISINISGIIFHIEEDGYETLRKYLDSINRYFGSFDDSSEILSDIESRIAEIFLSRLNDGKQVITADDVQSLIATMGNVNDFKAAEEPGEISDAPKAEQRQESRSTPPPASSKKLFRDQRRKILGGVCAGLGNYFNVDPVWPRLLFALLILGSYGGLLLVYIILWIALPVSDELEDEPTVKKMYRDPDTKVIGGVAGGVAAFFGAPVVAIRLLFVIFTLFFGTGIVVYIVLWIVLPEARTITERMQMQGEPVTLSNIESSVKKSLNEKDAPDESILAKIILFPFRIVAAVLNAIVNILGPLFRVIIDVIRVAIGLAISLTGLMLVLSLILAFGVLVGVFSLSTIVAWDVHMPVPNLPMEAIRQAFPTWTIVVAFLAAFIPALFVLLLGNSIIAKRIVFNGLVGWTLFVAFFVSLAVLSVRIPQLVYSFKEDGEYKVEKTFAIARGTPVLKMNETGLDDYHFTGLVIRGYEGNDLKLVERFGAQGVSRLQAKENAQHIEYNVQQQDSVITFDSNLSFPKGAAFSFQRLDLELYVPYDKPFVIDEELWRLIEYRWRTNSDAGSYDDSNHRETQTFRITKSGRHECLTCPASQTDRSGISADDQYGLKDFSAIRMTGAFNVDIRQGDEYAIRLEGAESQKQLYDFNVSGETLEVDYRTRRKNFWKNTFHSEDFVKLTIVMPSLHQLHVTGAGKLKISGFHEQEVKITMRGAMAANANVSVNELYVDISGPVVFDLEGEGNSLEATVKKIGQLRAGNYLVDHATVEARELGQARVNVKGTLEIEKDFTSSVRYNGNPEVIKRD